MDEAAPGEGDQVRLALAPAGEGGRPLPGATKLMRLLAGEDRAAVHDPGADRRDLAREHGDHRQVEERQALAEASEADQGTALRVGGDREQVGIAEALADRGRLGRCRRSALQIARHLLLDDSRDQEIAALDAIGSLAFE
jgi:hypothetical protein